MLSRDPATSGPPTSEIAYDLMHASLASCGAVGYLNTSVGDIILLAGRSRASFYRLFKSKADCFEAAYERKADWLVSEMLRAGGGDRCDLHAALVALAEFMVHEPAQARGLLIEAKVAAGAPPSRGLQTLKQLGRALDAGFRKGSGPPPPLAGEFAVAAIESLAYSALVNGSPRDFYQQVPGMVAFVRMIYASDGSS